MNTYDTAFELWRRRGVDGLYAVGGGNRIEIYFKSDRLDWTTFTNAWKASGDWWNYNEGMNGYFVEFSIKELVEFMGNNHNFSIIEP